jgi:DNA-binding GntR family transcriptional regulator
MSTVEEIVNAAKSLPPEQQAELKRRLELLAASQDSGGVQLQEETSGQIKELHERIHRAMYEAGLVSSMSAPVKRRRERPPPIEIKGNPLSETIIEDRR